MALSRNGLLGVTQLRHAPTYHDKVRMSFVTLEIKSKRCLATLATFFRREVEGVSGRGALNAGRETTCLTLALLLPLCGFVHQLFEQLGGGRGDGS